MNETKLIHDGSRVSNGMPRWHVIIALAAAFCTTGAQGATIFVDPSTNLFQVKQAAQAGDTIFAYPGLYTTGVTNLLKNRVDWFFLPGAVVSNYNSSAATTPPGIFDNSILGDQSTMTCRVGGYGTFIQVGGGQELGIIGLIRVDNASSDIAIECDKILITGDSSTFFACVVFEAGKFTLNVREEINSCYGLNEIGGVSNSGGVWWANGKGAVRSPRIFTGVQSALYGLGTTAASWDISVERLHSTNGPAVLFEPTHVDNKCWLTCNEAIGGSDAIARGMAVSQNGGKLYVRAQKLSSWDGIGNPVIGQDGGQLWVTANKVTTTNASPWLKQSAGRSWIRVDQWEDVGSGANTRPYSFLLSGGTNSLLGSSEALNLWGPGYKITGGEAYLRDIKINCTAAQKTNAPVWIAGGSMVLKSCQLTSIPNGSTSSVLSIGPFNCRVIGATLASTNVAPGVTQLGSIIAVNGNYDR